MRSAISSVVNTSPLLTKNVSSRPGTSDKRPRRSQWFVFVTVRDAHADALPVLEKHAQIFSQMTNSENGVIDAGTAHLMQENFENRHVSDRHQRQEGFFVRRKTRSLPPARMIAFMCPSVYRPVFERVATKAKSRRRRHDINQCVHRSQYCFRQSRVQCVFRLPA